MPNGIGDTQTALPDWQTRDRKVVAIGRLHPVKGYDRLLKAWAKVEAVNADWALEIAGPDPDGYGKELRRLVSSLGLRRAVIGPARYGADRDAMIAQARLFALPSLTENFALTVPEALMCGTPVVASTGGAPHGAAWWKKGAVGGSPPTPRRIGTGHAGRMARPDGALEAMGTAGGRSWCKTHLVGMASQNER